MHFIPMKDTFYCISFDQQDFIFKLEVIEAHNIASEGSLLVFERS